MFLEKELCSTNKMKAVMSFFGLITLQIKIYFVQLLFVVLYFESRICYRLTPVEIEFPRVIFIWYKIAQT